MTTTAYVAEVLDVESALVMLLDVVKGHYVFGENNGHLSDEILRALRKSGLFYLMLPSDLGGEECDPIVALNTIATVTKVDGASGWSLMAGMTLNAIAGSMLGDSAVKQMFRSGSNVTTCAGQVAPKGMAHRLENGFQVSGSFGFCSGGRHSQWIFGGFREVVDGKVVILNSGLPNVLGACVPHEHVLFQGNWDVMGLRGTGSYDYVIPEQKISEDFTFRLFDGVPLRGGALYRMGVTGITAIGHAAIAIGLARGALDELGEIAQTKRRLGKEVMVELSTFLKSYGEAEAAFRSAKAYVIDALSNMYEAARNDEVTIELRADARLAATNMVDVASKIAVYAHKESGSDGMRKGKLLERIVRDSLTAAQHVFTDEKTISDAASVFLGVARPSLVL